MSTFHELQARGIRVGSVVRVPTVDGQSLAKVTRLHFAYAMVRYIDGQRRGYLPSILTPASEEEAAHYQSEVDSE